MLLSQTIARVEGDSYSSHTRDYHLATKSRMGFLWVAFFFYLVAVNTLAEIADRELPHKTGCSQNSEAF
jgi:hypothetical protein